VSQIYKARRGKKKQLKNIFVIFHSFIKFKVKNSTGKKSSKHRSLDLLSRQREERGENGHIATKNKNIICLGLGQIHWASLYHVITHSNLANPKSTPKLQNELLWNKQQHPL